MLTYLIFIMPGLILALLAAWYTRSTFSKYAEISSMRGYTGAQAAYEMLRRKGVYEVKIERVDGMLTDHYDPSERTLRLSEAVYDSTSLSAIGVACHEAGHALQHAQGYAMLGLRTTLVPVTSICSSLYAWVIFAGALLRAPGLIWIGVAMCAAAVLFALVTLPVEWDASARAKLAMADVGLLSPQELTGASSVLNAAFLTYVAGAITALLTLAYYLFRLGVFGNSNNRD